MKRITTPALALFLLCTVAATAHDERPCCFEDGDLVLNFKNPDGWRFYRRMQRVESFQNDE